LAKKPAALLALKKLAAQPFTDENFRAVVDSLKNESDRAAVIIAGSLLEDELGNLISKVMRKLSTDDRQRLFGFDGPVGTFSNRILVAYALGLIDSNDRRQFDLLREMRNACAHSRIPLTFDTKELGDVTRLMVPEEMREGLQGAKLRATFILVCALLFVLLVTGKTVQGEQFARDIIDRKYCEADTSTNTDAQ
jgi:hypothetical protein